MINISIVKAEQFCSRKENKLDKQHLMQYNWVFILSLVWLSFSFTFYCLHKHKKQCQQNFAIMIFIYGSSMAAKAECHLKFRGLLQAEGCNKVRGLSIIHSISV